MWLGLVDEDVWNELEDSSGATDVKALMRRCVVFLPLALIVLSIDAFYIHISCYDLAF